MSYSRNSLGIIDVKDFSMKVFLVFVRDDNFCRLLPKELDRSRSDNGRIKVMGFPPLGIQTLAPVLRRHGHLVRLFDTCHPLMQAEHIAQAVEEEQPDVIALSCRSTTTYQAVKDLTPHHRGGGFCLHECGPHPGRLP
ncbi:MAG: cobalamin B12-binding domain-containing protein [Deltaproteobacteria bacterium]|nr:MAG: cobalamin B12-binding domain-containing protein [Deltaproteobacteria bacterium]